MHNTSTQKYYAAGSCREAPTIELKRKLPFQHIEEPVLARSY